MTEIVFERRLAVDVERAWALLTDPARMNEWSVAPVSAGAGGAQHAGGARTVHVRRFGVRLALVEEVVEVDPPLRFRYRVRPNWIVRRHDAEQVLTPTGDHVQLTWSVRIDAWVPGLMPLLVRSMRGQLEGSLDRLEAVAASDSLDERG